MSVVTAPLSLRGGTGETMSDVAGAILVVEDEFLLRLLIVEELEDEGFEVFEAANAAGAIRILEQHDTIRVLLTDVDLASGPNGIELGRLVRSRWPPIKIIVTSGHWVFEEGELAFAERFLPKPCSGGIIPRTIRDCLAI